MSRDAGKWASHVSVEQPVMPSSIRRFVVVFLLGAWTTVDAVEKHTEFQVVIAGGSTAAFAAAVSAAQSGARVALLEPTDWVGGQITSSGVPAIDEAWHKLTNSAGEVSLDVAAIARMPANISPLLRGFLEKTGCPGQCWVSRFCFEPKQFLQHHLHPLEASLATLQVFRETVVKRVDAAEGRITNVVAIQRTPRQDSRDGYDRLPSLVLPDWYSMSDSERFLKTIHSFAGEETIFIDATEWGEILALSDAPYLQGVETVDGGIDGRDDLGQSITFGFVQQLHEQPQGSRDADVPRPHVGNLGLGDYAERENGWQLVWTYRRLKADRQSVSTDDLSLQNWGYYCDRNEGGNDYPFGYLFLNREVTAAQRADWQGGVDLEVMAAAEQRAFAWHHWIKEHAPPTIDSNRISLAKHVLGTRHGLSKLPYIRDTRRSIGLGGFVLKVTDLMPVAEGKLAKAFEDRIALGAYPVDIHPMVGRKYPDYVYQHYPVAPFTIPFRALTNDRYANLLVAGKTMAQSFMANSATRLHPTEWSTGTAAGVAAATMAAENLSTRQLLRDVTRLQEFVAAKTPLDWSLP